MRWEDIAIAIAQASFILALIPAIRKHSTLPLATTSVSALASMIILIAVISLNFWVAAAMSVVKTSMWLILAWQSYKALPHK